MEFDFGLESLASELEADSTGVTELPIEQVKRDPEQPRTVFDTEKLERLADSIKAQGVIQPIIVRVGDEPDTYIIIAGERRWRASQIAGKTTIPAIIKESGYTEIVAAQIIENIDREGFTLFDEVKAVVRMCDICGTAKDAADTLGKTKAWVSQRVKIAKGGELIEEFILKGESTDVVGTYQLARLVERNAEMARDFIQQWIADPDYRGNLREKVAGLFVELDKPKPAPTPDTATTSNATNSGSVPAEKAGKGSAEGNTTQQTPPSPKTSVKPANGTASQAPGARGNPESVVDFEIQGDTVLLKTANKTVTINEALLRVIHDQL